VLTLLCLLYLVVARISYLRKQTQRVKIESAWIEVLKPSGSLTPPSIKRRQYPFVLDVWASYRNLAGSEHAAALDALAIEVGLDIYASKLLNPTDFNFARQPLWLSILAVDAAKWLKSNAVIESLWRALESDDKFLAVSACKCLVHLRAEEFEKAIIKILFRYPEEAYSVTSNIGAAGGGEILHLLHPVLEQLPRYTAQNFTTLAERSNDPTLLPILEDMLGHYRNLEEAAALIRSIGNIGSMEQRASIFPFLSSEETFLRIQATKALGRIGTPADITDISPLLTDTEWWLRFRAAEAIVNLCEGDREFIDDLIANQSDSFAADILRHAYKEKEWCLI